MYLHMQSGHTYCTLSLEPLQQLESQLSVCTQAQEASEKENVRSTKRVAEVCVCVCLMYEFEYILARYVV